MGQDMSQPGRRVVISADGGPSIGIGHVMRSATLAAELRREFAVRVRVPESIELPEFLVSGDWLRLSREGFISALSAGPPDVLVYDEPGDSGGLFGLLKQRVPALRIVALDFFDYSNDSVDAVVNLFNQSAEEPPVGRPGFEYYEGVEYAIIREETRATASVARTFEVKASRVVVSFGGADPARNTLRVLQMLEQIQDSGRHVDVAVGPLARLQMNVPAPSNVQVHLSPSPLTLSRLIGAADVVFCGGGTTVLEALCSGTPAVVLPQNPPEERFARSLENLGAVLVVGRQSMQDENQRVGALLASVEQRKEMSQVGRRLVDGKGVERIHRIVSGLLSRRTGD